MLVRNRLLRRGAYRVGALRGRLAIILLGSIWIAVAHLLPVPVGAQPSHGATTRQIETENLPAVKLRPRSDEQARDPHVAFYSGLALIQSLLRAGHELIVDGQWDEALPFVMRATDETYPALTSYMRANGIPGFEPDLKILARVVKEKKKEAYDAARLFVQLRIERALEFARRHMRPVRSYTLKTIADLLGVAQSEYELASESDGAPRIEHYRACRGIVRYAHQMFEDIAPELDAVDARRVDETRWAFVELKTSWPRPTPPAKASLTVDEVAARVGRIRDLLAAFK